MDKIFWLILVVSLVWFFLMSWGLNEFGWFFGVLSLNWFIDDLIVFLFVLFLWLGCSFDFKCCFSLIFNVVLVNCLMSGVKILFLFVKVLFDWSLVNVLLKLKDWVMCYFCFFNIIEMI